MWARKIWYHVWLGLWRDAGALGRALLDAPAFLLNDPYYPHKLLHALLGTWSWQFAVPTHPLLAAGDTPPAMHLWLTFSAET